MKRFLFFIFLIPMFASSQTIKMSQFPTFIGSPNGNWVPVIIANTNRKVDAKYFGYDKVDSLTTSQGSTYDSIHIWKHGVKMFSKVVRAGTAGSVAFSSITGKPNSLSGYGITDPVVTTSGSYANPGWISSLAYSKITGAPTVDGSETKLQQGSNITITGSGTTGDKYVISASGTGTGVALDRFQDSVTALKALIAQPTLVPLGTGLSYGDGNVIELEDRQVRLAPDANFTVTSADYYIILPDPTTTRTITLPPASTMQRQTKIYDCASTSSGEWLLSGSYIQKGTVGPLTENFVNSGIGSATVTRLASVNISGTWRWKEY